MVRALLVVVGIGLVVWDCLYRLGLRQAGYDPPVPTTVAQVLADYPCRWDTTPDYQSEKRVRLDGIEADVAQLLKSPSDEVWSYVRVKGTQDKLYLEFWREDVPPPGPITVFGYQRHKPAGSLPPQLESQMKQGDLFLVSYDNRNYYRYQQAEAVPYFILGGFVLGLAALSQGLVFLGGVWDKRKLAQASAAVTLASGPCTLCNTTAERIPVCIEAQKRRIAGPRLARVTTTTMQAECCPVCYTRLGKLWRVWTVGQIVTVPLLMLFIFGLILMMVSGPAVLFAACAVGLFFLLQYWINRRYEQILGPTFAQLKQALKVSIWNPLADKITYSKRFVASEKTLHGQR